MRPKRHVLVTDADRSLGRAVALRLADAGHRVMAGGRSLEALSDLPRETYARGVMEVCSLDTADPQSCREAVARTQEHLGGLNALVWAGGMATFGPVEEEGEEDAQASIEANLLAPWRALRAALPVLRGEPGSVFVAVSSAAGRVALPLGGAYSASRFALEGLCDALRLELASFGVSVCLVEPGLLRDRVHELRPDPLQSGDLFGVKPESPYAALAHAVTRGYDQLMNKAATHEQVADIVHKALCSKRPKTRYAVTRGAAALMLARRILPDRFMDRRLTQAVKKRGRRGPHTA